MKPEFEFEELDLKKLVLHNFELLFKAIPGYFWSYDNWKTYDCNYENKQVTAYFKNRVKVFRCYLRAIKSDITSKEEINILRMLINRDEESRDVARELLTIIVDAYEPND